MILNLIITGVGGQGNVLASQVLGHAAVHRGMNVTIGETFGLSQRGGAVSSHIRFSDSETVGPIIPPNMAHILVGLEPLEPVRMMQEFGNPNTIYLVNKRPIFPLNVIAGEARYPETGWIQKTLSDFGGKLFFLDATDVAVRLGGAILLNMVMIGALCALDAFPIQIEDVRYVVKDRFPEKKRDLNYQALDFGRQLLNKATV